MQELARSNDLGFQKKEVQVDDGSMISVEQSRAVAEVQASYVIAKKFPRNEHESHVKIIEACKRPFLAEQAMYAYPKGGSLVTGPSIRLAETMAQSWGNIDFGIRELSQSNGVSVAEAYAIDLQTNSRATKIFHIPHVRDTKKGRIKLTDARDIYEMVANQGSRRLRACILAILPGDVIESAVDQCKKTLEGNGEVPIDEQVKKMVIAFDAIGVKVEHLEKRLGHNLKAVIPQEIVTLKTIYKSLKDGFAKREDFFDITGNTIASESDIEKLLLEKDKLKKNKETSKEEQIDVKPSLGINFDNVKNQLLTAKSSDMLDIAADLINSVEGNKSELTEIYNKRKKDFK